LVEEEDEDGVSEEEEGFKANEKTGLDFISSIIDFSPDS
jgi:hypothetical protein